MTKIMPKVCKNPFSTLLAHSTVHVCVALPIVVGVWPMAGTLWRLLVLVMCQNIPGSPSLFRAFECGAWEQGYHKIVMGNS